MNTVIEMGRLTKDPQIRTSGETTIASFAIAVDRRFKRDGQPETDFFNCVAFGRQAEFAEKYLCKGIKMVIQGRLQNDNYQNKDGQMIYNNQIVVENMEFAESKKSREDKPQEKPKEKPKVDENGFMNIPEGLEEDLPFM